MQGTDRATVRQRHEAWVREQDWVRDFCGVSPDGTRICCALMVDGTWEPFREGGALPSGSVAFQRVTELRGVAQ